IQQAESTMAQNLDFILTGIRQAAGPTVPIVGMNYYDPFLGDWLAGGAVQVEANLSVSLVTQLNTLIAGAFQTVAAPTTDVAAAFDTTDLTDMVSSPWGQVPVAVDKACTWLDIVCTAGSTEGFGDDPNNDGAKVIAQAFEQTIGPAITPVTTSTTSTTSTSTSTSTTTSTTTSTSVPSPAQTTTSSPVVAARSGSLAFTGAGTPLRLMAVGGGLLASTGGLLLVAFGVPRRLRRSGR
ncbi:MAG TPA: hypothetical protein VKR22_00975, partial [Acidimicrobiales bacterium]|nr:hypothetical protein [Acidimicrobiales bacterium]